MPTEVIVNELIFTEDEKLKVAGVNFLADSPRHIAHAGREVIECVGSFAFPCALEHSDIGR